MYSCTKTARYYLSFIVIFFLYSNSLEFLINPCELLYINFFCFHSYLWSARTTGGISAYTGVSRTRKIREMSWCISLSKLHPRCSVSVFCGGPSFSDVDKPALDYCTCVRCAITTGSPTRTGQYIDVYMCNMYFILPKEIFCYSVSSVELLHYKKHWTVSE